MSVWASFFCLLLRPPWGGIPGSVSLVAGGLDTDREIWWAGGLKELLQSADGLGQSASLLVLTFLPVWKLLTV